MLAILALGLVFAGLSPDQEAIGLAKDLYAAAAYEEALNTLDRLQGSAGPELTRQIDQYRAFCLYALGQTAEADSVVEALIRRDPLFEPDRRDASPRVLGMFATVRKRVLPEVIRAEYQLARSARDSRDVANADGHFVAARRMLDEAHEIGAWTDALADLGVLVDGFLELSRAADRAPVTPVRDQSGSESVAPAEIEAVRSAARPDAPQASGHAKIYDNSNPDVVPPVAIRQVVPSVPPPLLAIMHATRQTGTLDLLIDEAGAVESVTMRESVNPALAGLLARAARGWKYRPATKGGVPVKYMKAVAIEVGDRR
jgi:tetratricopeptide (TPR) repeat protein